MNGGLLKSRKGVNLPDTRLPIPALTDKDIEDLRFALAAGVDLVALSFVRSPEDITQCREAMRAAGRVVPIIAKIEKKEAVDRLAAVLAESDGAMVARGDLGIEVPMEQVPSIQKRVITTCNRLAKPVIVATQMLESMIHSPRPTRAEVADIYNAILDGTDAIMLSAETASGKYPVEAVEVMDNVAGEAESQLTFWQKGLDWVLEEGEEPSITHVTCNSAVAIAEKLRLDLIIVPTVTGYSALHVSRFRPSVPVFACSGSTATVNALCLTWGVQARLMEPLSNEERRASETDALVKESIRCAREHGFLHRGQRALVIGGVPFGASHDTNYIQIVDVN
jgi:pyruvate kinase